MRLLAAVSLALGLVSAAVAISPPVDPPTKPFILPSPPPSTPPSNPPPADPNIPTLNTPEPSSMTIAGVSLAAAGVYRFVRRRRAF
jgi:hypothetical protein